MSNLARVIVVLEVVVTAFFARTPVLCVCLVGMLLWALLSPKRDSGDILRMIAVVFLGGAMFLTLIHGVNYSQWTLNKEGLRDAFVTEGRIGVVFAGVLGLSRTVQRETLYADLVSVSAPYAWTIVALRAFGVIADLRGRVQSAALLQALRTPGGLSYRGRWAIAARATRSMLTSALLELTDSSAVMVTRGILLKGPKSSLHRGGWTIFDAASIVAISILCSIALTVL